MAGSNIQRLFIFLLTLGLALGLTSCSDDDDPTGVPDVQSRIVGTWVEYENRLNDQAIPGSGWWVTLRDDGTGTSYEMGEPGYEDHFTWTYSDGQLHVTSSSGEYPPVHVDVDLHGNRLITTEVDDHGTWESYMQRHTGPEVLLDEWQVVSHYDAYEGRYVEESGSVVFGDDGTARITSPSGTTMTEPYTVEECLVLVGENPGLEDCYLYAVVHDTLYLIQCVWIASGPYSEAEPYAQVYELQRL